MARQKKLAPITPGEILKEEFMLPLGVNVNRLALALRVPATRISEIVNGQRRLTPSTALRLARYFGTTPLFWINLQAQYELELAEDEESARVYREVEPMEVQTPAPAFAAKAKD